MDRPRLMGKAELIQRLEVKKTRIDSLAQTPDFPKPIVLVGGRIWLADEIDQWILKHRPELVYIHDRA